MNAKASPAIGSPAWRPKEVHPLAALFPPLSDEDLRALASDIKDNGLLHPIIIDEAGLLIDGRMRLKACELAGVDPDYEFLNGADPGTLIWGLNAKRRHMTKGQMAMIAAMDLSIEPIESTGGRPDTGITRAAKAAGVSRQRLGHALTVKDHAPHLVDEVINGTRKLDDAYKFALEHKREQEKRTNGLSVLERRDPDLAQRVRDQEITLDEAFTELDDRAKAEAVLRDAVFLSLKNLTRSTDGFSGNDVLDKIPTWLNSDEGAEDLKRYFKGGVKETLDRIAEARRSLDAIEAKLTGGD